MKVAIIYPYFAHYRRPVIDALSTNEEVEFHFIGGTVLHKGLGSIKLVEFKNNDKFHPVTNLWMSKYFLYQKGVLSILKKEKYDAVVLFADWKYLSHWLVIASLRMRGIPVVFWSHGFLNNTPSINNYIKRLFFGLFTGGGMVYDNRAKDIFWSYGFKKDIEVIYNSLDFDYQRKVYSQVKGRKVQCSKGVNYFVFSGRLIKDRRLDIMFEAMSLIKRKGVDVSFIIIGTGPVEDEYKHIVSTLGLNDSVHFIGACYDEAIICEYYINSLGCVFPGPVGLTAMHAMTYGVPVITNDDISSQKPEFEAIKDGVNGFLFEHENPNSLADILSHVISLSDEERDKISVAALNTIQKYYTPQVQNKLISQFILRLA